MINRDVTRAIEPGCAELVEVFDRLFASEYNTRLIIGGDEPIYLPADSATPFHRVVFARGFFSSALHEIAHWCVAGERRRQQVDYGYWYVPDGRNAEQQAAFEKVEVKPQALEWMFSLACGRGFRISSDNLSGVETDSTAFKRAVTAQVHEYCWTGLPARAGQFRDGLVKIFAPAVSLSADAFRLEDL